jgi:hypothetical protein
VSMANPRDKRSIALFFRPIDCGLLQRESVEHVSTA